MYVPGIGVEPISQLFQSRAVTTLATPAGNHLMTGDLITPKQ